MQHIQENSRVTLHFALRLAGGETVDSTFEGKPATLNIGDGNLPEGFEKHLLGLSVGDHRTVQVPPEDGFGQPNPQNRQTFKRDQFPEEELEPGMVMSFADASQSELPGVIAEIEGEFVTVDFNHPLAGKTLDFEVKIIDIEAADHGH
ncbi:MAG: FKBP-type peptidyl-prolyl cis-trans isomerase [Saccharospirillum sp.]